MEQVISLVNTTGAPVRGVRLGATLTRTELRSVEVSGLPTGVRVSSRHIVELSIEVRWDGLLPDGASIQVVADVVGEPLAVEHIVWLGMLEEDRALQVLTEKMYGDAVRAARQPFSAAVRSPTEIFERRAAAIRRVEDPVVRSYMEFFYDYDRATYIPLFSKLPESELSQAERERRIKAIRWMLFVLETRLITRCREARLGRVPSPADLAVSECDDTGYISSLQLRIYRKHFGDPVDLTRFADAFLRFANGELQVTEPEGKWNGEPDSAYAFLFAEFATMAIDQEIDDDAAWRALLPALVAMQPLFTRVYRPPDDVLEPLYGADYTSTNFMSERQLGSGEKAALWARFAGLDGDTLRREMGRHAFTAFAGGRVRPGG